MSKLAEDVLGWGFILILGYLVIRNAPAINNIVNSLGNAGQSSIMAFQGR